MKRFLLLMSSLTKEACMPGYSPALYCQQQAGQQQTLGPNWLCMTQELMPPDACTPRNCQLTCCQLRRLGMILKALGSFPDL